MKFTFYLVDQKQMPPESAARTAAATPEAITALIRSLGGRWSTVYAEIDEFADAFETLDRFTGGNGLLPDLAFRGSPNFLLVGYPGKWRLGYVEASLVPALAGAFRLQSSEVEQLMGPKGDTTDGLYNAFVGALDDANERNLDVAIIHGS